MGKLSFEVNAWTPGTLAAIIRAAPDYLKVLELNHDSLVAYKKAVPHGKVLYRRYVKYQPLDNPVANANTFADDVISDLKNYAGLVDIVEGYNECGLWADAVNFNLFTVQLANRMHAVHLEYCCGSFAEENPDMSLWHVYLPGILASDYLGLHEYSAPTMQDAQGTRCFHYRQVYTYLKTKVPNLKIMITECGIDGGVIGKAASGFQQFGGEAVYLPQVKWYTEGAAQDSYIVAIFLFCCGTSDPQWNGFDVKNCLTILDYCRSLMTPIVTPPVVKPVTSRYPAALWLPSPNFGYPKGTKGRNGQKPIAIVCHIAQGSESALDSEFANNTVQKSATYASNKDGTVHQYCENEDSAWANGVDFALGYGAYKSNLNLPWIKNCWDKQLSPNLFTLSIEHEGFTGVTLPEAQYQGTLNLIDYLVRTFGIPIDSDHITGHFSIDSVTRSMCPGSAFPWARLYKDLHTRITMVNYLGAPHGGPTDFRAVYSNKIGSYSQVLIQAFSNGCLWASPDTGWVATPGLPLAMTDAQVRAYASDIWSRGGAQFVAGQSLCEAWVKGLLALRA